MRGTSLNCVYELAQKDERVIFIGSDLGPGILEDFKKNIGEDCVIYRPKILIKKYKNNKLINKELDILGDYAFCFHKL